VAETFRRTIEWAMQEGLVRASALNTRAAGG
jgi:hypothetical protein